jgi:deazaflavin-dependent oxidoreductase (nitroreductase family)
MWHDRSMTIDAALGDEDYCYVTTTGRVTGRPHRIEIWFALEGATIYILAGGGRRSDWVKNAIKKPRVDVRIGRKAFDGTARIVEDAREDALARRMLLEKYAKSDSDLDEWGRTALPVAIDLTPSRDEP